MSDASAASRTAPAQAVITYVSQNYDIKGALVGRQSASEGFLRAYAKHGGADPFVCLTTAAPEIDGFKSFIAEHAPKGTRAEGFLPTEMMKIAQTGTLYRPGPDLAYFAWLRRGLGQRSFSICGVNHTLSDEPAMASIGRSLIGPVQDWDALICTSAASKAAIQRILEEYAAYIAQLTGVTLQPRLQLPLIPLGVDCDALTPPEGDAAARAAQRKRLGIADDEIVLLYLGRFNHVEKANPIAMYIAAEQAAQRTKRKIRMVEVGWFPTPEMEQGFRQLAGVLSPSVQHLYLDGRDFENRKVWSAADIFISLSDNVQESFGLTPIEAMAAGLPVIVSDWDGYRDSVRDGVDGYRIQTIAPPPGMGEALAFMYAAGYGGHDVMCGAAAQSTAVHPGIAANAVVKLIENESERRAMGEAGRKRAREVFDWPVIIRAYQALWADLAERRAKAPEIVPPVQGKPTRPLAMDPLALFREFPTRFLVLQVKITLTPGVDAALAQGMTKLPIATPLRAFMLDDAGLARIVERLQQGAATVQELLDLFPQTQRQPCWYLIGWLCKTGLATWA
jgi:glycosyltransferase involved in cell wall biosynthesis